MADSVKFKVAFEPSNMNGRILPMEGLRGLAILMVFICHFDVLIAQRLPLQAPIGRYLDIMGRVGEAGVDLFFVISGFLIYRMLLGKKVSYITFVNRRIRRIYPAFLVTLAIFVILSIIFPKASRLPARSSDVVSTLLLNVALLPGFVNIKPIVSVAWSLSYELYFYLAAPLLIRSTRFNKLSRRSRLTVLVVISVAFIAFSVCAPMLTSATHLPLTRCHVRLVMFLCGMIVVEIISASNAFVSSVKGERIALISIVIGVICLSAAESMHGTRSPRGDDVQFDAFRCVILSMILVPLCVMTLGEHGVLPCLFSLRPFRWFGNMSYSYYLVHTLPLNGLTIVISYGTIYTLSRNHPDIALVTLLPLSFILTVAVGVVFYLLIEGQIWRKKHKGMPATISSVTEDLTPVFKSL
jgi:peptidoglycan/LPS O-acetylase OafA/YrhL